MADAQLQRRIIAGAECDVCIAIRLDATRSALEVKVLALEPVALRLHVYVTVELKRAQLAIHLNLVGGEFDAVLMGGARRRTCGA